MKVRLIAITQPVIEECSNPRELLAYCARVSNSANQSNHATGPKLLKRLVDKKEWSPFEMVSLTMEITTTRDIARQILRHRSFSFQEFSQRYAAVTAPPVLREARMQDHKNRQSSLETDDETIQVWWADSQYRVAETAIEVYEEALSRGIAKEVARAVLPEGMTESRLYMAGTLRSWLHYCQLRAESETQKEHRLVPLACQKAIVEYFPDTASLFA